MPPGPASRCAARLPRPRRGRRSRRGSAVNGRSGALDRLGDLAAGWFECGADADDVGAGLGEGLGHGQADAAPAPVTTARSARSGRTGHRRSAQRCSRHWQSTSTFMTPPPRSSAAKALRRPGRAARPREISALGRDVPVGDQLDRAVSKSGRWYSRGRR